LQDSLFFGSPAPTGPVCQTRCIFFISPCLHGLQDSLVFFSSVASLAKMAVLFPILAWMTCSCVICDLMFFPSCFLELPVVPNSFDTFSDSKISAYKRVFFS
jgi:hypothetical protein